MTRWVPFTGIGGACGGGACDGGVGCTRGTHHPPPRLTHSLKPANMSTNRNVCIRTV